MVMMPPRAAGSPVRLLLADSRPLYRSGLTRLLAEAPTLQVLGEASTAPEVLEAVAALAPDVVVLDPALPGGALAMVRALRSRFPHTEVLLYGVGDDDALFIDALHAGVKGFADQTTDVHYLSSAIHSVAAGEVMVSPGLARHIAASYAALLARERAGTRVAHSELTERELDVLRLVAAGRHNRTIAVDLGLSEHTVRAHLRGISRKLGVQNRVQAVAEALRQGLIVSET
jgi:DNA-binding NarL/FixJ family response regulator